MEWKTPKTDWQSSDRYDYREINKLNDNLSIVEKETEKIFDFYAPKNMRNLIPFPYYDGMSKTHNGITFTVNDGIIIANGTATNVAGFLLSARVDTKNPFHLPNAMYTLRGCPKGGGTSTYSIALQRGTPSNFNGVYGYDYGDGFITTIDDGIENTIQIQVTVAKGCTVNNLVFKPMLTCEESQYKPTDIPYASTFNEIEDRLHAVNGAGYGYDIGAKKTFVANQPVMDFAELNRVESALERLHIENQNNIEILPKLTFRLGNMRGVKI